MRNPKMLKEVRVESHVRKTPGGGTTTVKQYRETREVNVEELSEKSIKFLDDAKELRAKLFDENGKMKIPRDEAERQVIGLYKTKGNGVEDELSKYESSIGKLHEGSSNVFTSYEDPNLISNLSKNSDTIHEKILNLLTNPEFIHGTIKKTNEVKSAAEKMFGVKTEEIDPFSFRFETKYNNESNPESIIELLTDKKVFENIYTLLSSNHKDVFGESPLIDKDTVAFQLMDMKKNNLFSNRKATSTIIPSILATALIDYKMVDRGSISGLIPKLFGIRGKISENPYQGILMGEPGKIRKIALDHVKESNIPTKDKEEVTKYLNKVEDKAIIPFINAMTFHDCIPKFLVDNPKILPDLQRVSENIREMMGNINVTGKKMLTMSRNPLSILTMSPHKAAPSCQSILTKDGELKLGDSYAVNIPGSVNTHRTYDTILFMNNDKGEKNARISITLDSKKESFISFQYPNIFGESSANRKVINDFIKQHGGTIRAALPKEKTYNYFTNIKQNQHEPFNAIAQSIGGKMHAALKNGDVEHLKPLKRNIDEANKMLTEYINEINSESFNYINEQLKIVPTFLYGSGTQGILDTIDSYTRTSLNELYATKNSFEFLDKRISKSIK